VKLYKFKEEMQNYNKHFQRILGAVADYAHKELQKVGVKCHPGRFLKTTKKFEVSKKSSNFKNQKSFRCVLSFPRFRKLPSKTARKGLQDWTANVRFAFRRRKSRPDAWWTQLSPT